MSTSFGAALAAAFAGIDHAIKNATNPHFKSTYANLATVLDVVRAEYKKHGLAIVQMPGPIFKAEDLVLVSLETTIIHESGEKITSIMNIPVNADKNGKVTPHAVGSAITYARRYALAAMAGITQDDDDGNGAVDDEESVDETDSVVEELYGSIAAATSVFEMNAFKDAVGATGDVDLVAAYKTKYKELKKSAKS